MNNEVNITHHTTHDEYKEFEYHFHLHFEIIFVMQGSVDMYSNGKEVTLTAGMACMIPAFTPHKTRYENATVKHVVFDSYYISNYLSTDTIEKFPAGFDTNVIISKKPGLSETIDDLINEMNAYRGESAYIYLYKLIMACSPMYNIHNTENKKPILKIMNYIGVNSKNKLSLDDIAKNCGVSKYHICRMFKKELGITPVDYITFAKIRRAVTKLYNTDNTIAKISDGLSFYSPKYFTKIFKSYFDVSPSEFRKLKNFRVKERYYLKISDNDQ